MAAISFAERLRSFGFASRGLGYMLRTQHNAWIHAAATVGVLGAGLFFGISRSEWLAVLLAIVAVWVAEALNTAFESLCDVVSPDFHPSVKQAKDTAAGAVLVAAIGALAVALVIFVPRLWQLGA